MRDTEVCRRLLGIEEPWTVNRLRIDTQTRELHAFVGRGQGWLARVVPDQPKSRWRHCNVGAYKAFIHATVTDGFSDEDKRVAFIGRPDTEFTTGLARKVTDCLKAGLRYREVCQLLDIDVHLAWQIRHAIQEGLLGKDMSTLADSMVTDLEQDVLPDIPPVSDVAWRRLLSSEGSLNPRLLSLRLLLTRARQEFGRLEDESARMIRINEIRRFFIKHRKQLGYEIEQLQSLRAVRALSGDREHWEREIAE